jgi:hypothetical protein
LKHDMGGLKNHECNTSLNKYWQLEYYNKKNPWFNWTFSSYGQPQLMAKCMLKY